MVDEISVYVSASPELDHERELLGQLIAEIPVTLGWRIFQSPSSGEQVDVGVIRGADIHIFVIGSDIRAPIGFEWLLARRSNKTPWLLLKVGILQTQAAQDFIRWTGEHAEWKYYQDSLEFRRNIEGKVAGHILAYAELYNIQGKELDRFVEWQKDQQTRADNPIDETSRGAGKSGVIISPERYVPRDGVLLKDPAKED